MGVDVGSGGSVGGGCGGGGGGGQLIGGRCTEAERDLARHDRVQAGGPTWLGLGLGLGLGLELGVLE